MQWMIIWKLDLNRGYFKYFTEKMYNYYKDSYVKRLNKEQKF